VKAPRIGFITAVVIGAALALWLLGGDRDPDAAPLAECRCGHVVTSGVLRADPEHPTFSTVEGLLIVSRDKSTAGSILGLYDGKRVEIVIREAK
jgi:hypothetical protein